MHEQALEQEIRFLQSYLLRRTTLRYENVGHSEKSLGAFIQCQYTRNILKNKNIRQILFRKHSNFQNFDEIFCCAMTRFRNTNFDLFMQCQYTRTILISMKYFTVAWRDSGTRFLIIVICVNTWKLLNQRKKLFENHLKFQNFIFNKAFYCDMAKSGYKCYYKKENYETR